MISTLSTEDLERIEQVKDKWTKVGLSTNTDRELAESYLSSVYASWGPAPDTRFWVQSPISGLILVELVETLLGEKEPSHNPTPDFLKDVFLKTCKTLSSQIAKYYQQGKLCDPLKNVCEDFIQKADAPTLQEMLENKLSNINYAFTENSISLLNNCAFGTHDAGFFSFFDYFTPLLPDAIRPLEGLINFSQHVGWWWPYDEMVVISDKPSKICLDDQNRLHCDHGYAIEYGDGWGFCCWHGYRLSDENWILNKEAVDPLLALNHENAEMSRVLIEIIGWDKIVEELQKQGVNLQKVQEDKYGTLFYVNGVNAFENGETQFVKVKCVTGREYFLPVGMGPSTAHEGVALTFGLTADEYHPDIET